MRRTTEECARLGIEQLTLYCLSSENWKRPRDELDFLMELLRRYMIDERASIRKHDLRVSVIGRREGIPADVFGAVEQDDRNEPCQYRDAPLPGDQLWRPSGIGRRRPRHCPRARSGELSPEQITEQVLSDHLYTAGMPEPDLLIRTASEMRISNFLLWQISYAEIWVTGRLWPEFDEELLRTAIRDFAARDRRFGGLKGVDS